MPLGIVSDDIFEKELEKCIHVDIVRGRNGARAVPEVIREIIAEEAIVSDKSGKEIADEFGVSASSVSAYKNSATSTATYHEPNKQLQERNDKLRSEVISTARSRLFEALSHITAEKLKDAKVRDVASVAKDMSTIIHNTEPSNNSAIAGAQFHFHVPAQKSEKDYDIIDVS
jgi:transposase